MIRSFSSFGNWCSGVVSMTQTNRNFDFQTAYQRKSSSQGIRVDCRPVGGQLASCCRQNRDGADSLSAVPSCRPELGKTRSSPERCRCRRRSIRETSRLRRMPRMNRQSRRRPAQAPILAHPVAHPVANRVALVETTEPPTGHSASISPPSVSSPHGPTRVIPFC